MQMLSAAGEIFYGVSVSLQEFRWLPLPGWEHGGALSVLVCSGGEHFPKLAELRFCWLPPSRGGSMVCSIWALGV